MDVEVSPAALLRLNVADYYARRAGEEMFDRWCEAHPDIEPTDEVQTMVTDIMTRVYERVINESNISILLTIS